jgi:predicted secreted protein
MRRLILFFLIIACSYAADTVIVNKDFNGKAIKIRTGDTVRVELSEAGATGYSWEIKDLDREHFEVVGTKTEAKKTAGNLVGAPVLKIWLIRAKAAGSAGLKFLYYRPWEGDKSAIDQFAIQVQIEVRPKK